MCGRTRSGPGTFSCNEHIMNKLVLLGAAILATVTVALMAPGCADSCENLSPICDTCGDADYAASCRQTVTNNNQDVCAFQSKYFDSVCNATADGGAGGGNGVCTHGEVTCQGSCVDIEADAAFCGSCVSQCADGQVCGGGACLDGCTNALPLQCGSGCVNPDNDPLYCGDCPDAGGEVCAADKVCENGVCTDGCDPNGATPTECDGSCVSLSQSTLNCGACGNACGPGILCSAGTCSTTCDGGLTACAGTCVDTSSEAAHCGTCNNDCTTQMDRFCADGNCAPDCGGLTTCGNNCVDVFSDGANCGACGNLCANGTVCTNGSCTAGGCLPGQSNCNGACVNLDTSPANCGACGEVCNGQVCNLGVCAPACTIGLTNCSNSCVDTQGDPNHCGGCGIACAGDQVCDLGTCKAACEGGRTNCNRTCADTGSALFHCGSCGNSCSDKNICTGDACAAGECSNLSGAVFCDDGNACTDESCDPKLGCVAPVPITLAELEALCLQLNPDWDKGDGCIHCDPDGELCNFADNGAVCHQASAYTTCAACRNVAGGDSVCDDVMPPQVCPPAP